MAEKMPPAAGTRAFFDAAGRRGRRPPTGEGVFRLRAGRGSFTPLRGYTSSAPCGGTFPSRGRLVVTFFYKPIDIVGFMCYHAITYKKDMLKE